MSVVDLYARISDDRTGLAAGVQRQEKEARALAARRGWVVGQVHVDNDIKASRFGKKTRPAYLAMIERIEAGQVDGIVAFHTDRLYRRPRELEDLIDLVEHRGLVVATCEGDFDLGSSDGRMVARMLVTMAAKESDDKSRRLRSKHRELAEAGKVGGGGRRPFGYQQDRVTIREDEAAIIRQGVDAIISGESLRGLTMRWRAAGIQTVTGVPWQSTTVKRLLCSARIAGRRSHKGNETRAVWPEIITPDQSMRVRLILNDPNRDRTNGVEPRTYLLTGLVYCAACDVPMTTMPVWRKGTKYRRYQCRVDRGGCDRVGISADRLEADIGAALDLLLRDRRGRKLAGRLSVVSDEQRLMDAIERDKAELKAWARDLAQQKVGKLAYLAAAGELEAQIDGAEAELRRAQAEMAVDDLVEGDEPWDEMTWSRQQKVAARFIAKIPVQATSRSNNRYDRSRWDVEWA